MLIRDELGSDVSAIDRLTTEAFLPMSFSSGTEAQIIHRLRASGDLTVSLVALDVDVIVGHVAFSPVLIGDSHDGWYGLGPISVRSDHQRQGIGTALTAAGVRRLEDVDAKGIALIGDPAVYRPMGFVSASRLHHDGVDDALVQFRVLNGMPPAGELRFAAAFG